MTYIEKIGEKIWKAETLIRGEGYTKYNQPQRIGILNTYKIEI